MSYLLTLTLTLAACFGLQSLALRAVGGRTNKSESNFFSSVARIQTGIRDQPDIMLLGSSITGRLPDRSQGFPGVANLGCDGSNAIDTLRAMDRGQLPCAPLVIIEGNTLYRSVGGSRSEIATAIGSPWFRIGCHLPNLSATSRPAAFLYSHLLSNRIGHGGAAQASSLVASNTPSIAAFQSPSVSQQEAALIAEVSGMIDRLGKKGTRFLVTILPPGGDSQSAHVRLPKALALEANVPFWDLSTAVADGSIRFTDGVHMTPQSAASIMTLLLANLPSK